MKKKKLKKKYFFTLKTTNPSVFKTIVAGVTILKKIKKIKNKIKKKKN